MKYLVGVVLLAALSGCNSKPPEKGWDGAHSPKSVWTYAPRPIILFPPEDR